MITLIAWGVAAGLLIIGALVGTYYLRKRENEPPPWHASRFDYAAVPPSNSKRRDAQEAPLHTAWPDVESVLPSLDEFQSLRRSRAGQVDIDLPESPPGLPAGVQAAAPRAAPRPAAQTAATAALGGGQANAAAVELADPAAATVSIDREFAGPGAGTVSIGGELASPGVGTVSVAGEAARPRSAAAPTPDDRVLLLQIAHDDEWAAAEPIELSSLDLATLAAVLAAPSGAGEETVPAVAEERLLLIRFPRAAVLRITRADQPYMKALAAANATLPVSAPAAWLDAKSTTLVASTLLALLSCTRHLDPVRSQIHELRAALAGLIGRSDERPAAFLKASAQELARFVREAHDNPAWALARPALRDRVADACGRGLQVWRDLHVEIDAVRQQLEKLSAVPYFSDSHLLEATGQLRELLARRLEIDVLACLLAGLHRLRLGFGDGPAPGRFDPLQSAVAALDAGRDHDIAVAHLLGVKEGQARNDFYIGKVEFEERRAELRAHLGALQLDAPSTGRERLGATLRANAEGFPEASGADECWLVRRDKTGRVTAVRRFARAPASVST